MEDIACHGYGSDGSFQEHVRDHAGQGYSFRAAAPGREHDEKGGDACHRISNARDPSDQSVEAEANLGSGDAEDIVEERSNVIEVFVRSELARHRPCATLYMAQLAGKGRRDAAKTGVRLLGNLSGALLRFSDLEHVHQPLIEGFDRAIKFRSPGSFIANFLGLQIRCQCLAELRGAADAFVG